MRHRHCQCLWLMLIFWFVGLNLRHIVSAEAMIWKHSGIFPVNASQSAYVSVVQTTSPVIDELCMYMETAFNIFA